MDLLGGHFSAFHRSTLWTPKDSLPSCIQTAISPIPRSPKALAHYKSKLSSKSHRLQTPKSSDIGESLHAIHPVAKFLSFCPLVKWENKLYTPKLGWAVHRVTVTDTALQKRWKQKEKRSLWSQPMFKGNRAKTPLHFWTQKWFSVVPGPQLHPWSHVFSWRVAHVHSWVLCQPVSYL